MADRTTDADARVRRVAELLKHGPHLADLHRAAAATIGAACLDARPHRFHHRPGRSVTRVDRAVVSRGGRSNETLLVAHVHLRGEPEAAEHVDIDGTPIAVWAFPRDPYLVELPSATDTEWVAQLLESKGLRTAGLYLKRRAYRPTRAAVIEARVAGSGQDMDTAIAYLKVLRPNRVERIAKVHAELGRSLPVPQVLGHQPGLLILEVARGVPLRRALRRGRQLPETGSLVDLSVRLATTDADAGGSRDHNAGLVASASRLAAYLPGTSPKIDAVVAASRSVEGRCVTVHGDFHGGQILVSKGRVTGLIDLDGVGRGRMVHDAANLIAYLEVQGTDRPKAAPRSLRYAAEVAMAYSSVLDPGSLARATAARWLALAVVALRAGDEAESRRRVDRAFEHVGNAT